MVSYRLRLIREKNRVYSTILRLLYFIYPNRPRVYLFHDILQDIAQVKSKFAISKKSFEYFLQQHLDAGFKPLTEENLSDIVKKGSIGYERAFMITFDDVNESVYTIAYPFLKSHEVPFILFITWHLLDKPNYLTTHQLLELSKDPLCTIGSHAFSHKMFRYQTNAEAEYELTASRQYLESLIAKPVEIFAFPYGRIVECSRDNIRQVQQAGYSYSFSAISSTLNSRTLKNSFFLPRINVDERFVRQMQ